MSVPKFPKSGNSFHVELKNRINDYFASTNQSVTGGMRIYSKAIILYGALIYCYIQTVFFTPDSVLLDMLLCVIIGALISGVGFNVMHDGGARKFQ